MAQNENLQSSKRNVRKSPNWKPEYLLVIAAVIFLGGFIGAVIASFVTGNTGYVLVFLFMLLAIGIGLIVDLRPRNSLQKAIDKTVQKYLDED